MNIKKLWLLFNTVRYLKLKQIVYRLINGAKIIRPNYLCPRDGNLAAKIRWTPVTTVHSFPKYFFWKKADILNNTFRFLNVSQTFDGNIQWGNPIKGRLWLYNLNYFQYLFPGETLNSEKAVKLISSWINENSPGSTNSWDPYPTSLRLVNWIKYLNEVTLPPQALSPILESLYHQIRCLEKSIEYHLLGNHLFRNAKALIFAGLFFKGDEPDRWLEKGVQILKHEMDEQILSDGGHFERSPMYHSMILEDSLDLINLCKPDNRPPLDELTEKLCITTCKMIAFLNGMTHPDGQIALFNDAAFGIELPPLALFKYYSKVTGNYVDVKNDSAVCFPETGYYILAPSADSRLLIDCGPIGPNYQPGHSHCDALSFELTLKGQRVVVDSGCCQYEDSPIRQYNRGNAGHNVLTIDDLNQSEVWGAHRCARRARPIYARAERGQNGSLVFEGAHDGYRRLSGSPVHHRRVQWSDDRIQISDQVEGRGQHMIELRLHIHPDLKASHNMGFIEIRRNHTAYMIVSLIGLGRIDIEKGWYCPEFGLKRKCPVLVARFNNETLPFKTGWQFDINPG